MIALIMSLFLGLSAQASEVSAGKWSKGAPSVLLSQGLKITNPNMCENFEVEMAGENLQYKFRCGNYFTSSLLPLKSNSIYQVTRKERSITITKMGYYGQKIQTGKISQNLVSIPYVEEVIYINFSTEGHLSFYKEKFAVDDFGRIVQDHFMQAYDLTKRQVKISQSKVRLRSRRQVNRRKVQTN